MCCDKCEQEETKYLELKVDQGKADLAMLRYTYNIVPFMGLLILFGTYEGSDLEAIAWMMATSMAIGGVIKNSIDSFFDAWDYTSAKRADLEREYRGG